MFKIIATSLLALSITGCTTVDLNNLKMPDFSAFSTTNKKEEVKVVKEVNTPIKKEVSPGISTENDKPLDLVVDNGKPIVVMGKIVQVTRYTKIVDKKKLSYAKLGIVSNKEKRIDLDVPFKKYKAGQDVIVTSEKGKQVQVEVM